MLKNFPIVKKICFAVDYLSYSDEHMLTTAMQSTAPCNGTTSASFNQINPLPEVATASQCCSSRTFRPVCEPSAGVPAHHGAQHSHADHLYSTYSTIHTFSLVTVRSAFLFPFFTTSVRGTKSALASLLSQRNLKFTCSVFLTSYIKFVQIWQQWQMSYFN